jgi:hypothetical protein
MFKRISCSCLTFHASSARVLAYFFHPRCKPGWRNRHFQTNFTVIKSQNLPLSGTVFVTLSECHFTSLPHVIFQILSWNKIFQCNFKRLTDRPLERDDIWITKLAKSFCEIHSTYIGDSDIICTLQMDILQGSVVPKLVSLTQG